MGVKSTKMTMNQGVDCRRRMPCKKRETSEVKASHMLREYTVSRREQPIPSDAAKGSG